MPYSDQTRFRRGPWRRGGKPSPAGWPFGLLLPETTLKSAAYVTQPAARRALGRQRLPFWNVINYSPAALVSADDHVLADGNFVALAFVGNSEQGPGSFQTQWFQLVDTGGGQGFRFSRIGIIDSNAVGTGARPFALIRPYPMPNLLALLNRTANRATVEQDIQLCVYGVQEFTL